MNGSLEAFLTFEVPESHAAIWWLGQGSFAFKTSSGKKIFVDPYLSNSLETHLGWKRWFPPLIAPKDVKADAVIVTHDHLDHVDPDTVPGLAENSGAVFAGPQSCLDHLIDLGVSPSETIQLEAGESITLAGIEVKASHADHMHPSAPVPDAISIFLNLEGVKVLNAADTTYRTEVIEPVKGTKPDVLLVPINGRWGNMDGTDAAQYTRDVSPRTVIPMHYGLMSKNTTDPKEFLDALAEFAPQVTPKLMSYSELFLAKAAA